MSSTLSPNMSLIVPGIGTEPGPTWANDLNADLGILDQHNHTPGRGLPISPAAMDINIDLPMNDHNLTTVKTINFQAQPSSFPGASPNLGCIYVAGNELFYNDESGNVIAITNTGSVNAGAGSITGLPSGTASAVYSAGAQTFTWQSATSTSANMDMGSIVLRNVVANSNGITISAFPSLPADYTITLPASLPGALQFLTLDSSGNVGYISNALGITNSMIANSTIQRGKLAPLGQQVSSSCGTTLWGFNSPSYSPITNLSVTLTTTGRPVMLFMQPDGITDCLGKLNTVGNQNFLIAFFRDSTNIAEFGYNEYISNASEFFRVDCQYFDVVAAGTYTYTVQIRVAINNGISVEIDNFVLAAYELF